jgi:hypothetical protein
MYDSTKYCLMARLRICVVMALVVVYYTGGAAAGPPGGVRSYACRQTPPSPLRGGAGNHTMLVPDLAWYVGG